MYLTEEGLGDALQIIYPSFNFVRDQKIKNSNILYRPDYYCGELNLAIEFDGYLHYTDAKTIYRDGIKDLALYNMRINIVRIPYFVQLSDVVINLLFGIRVKYPQNYPHGFIDKRAVLPANFCELGILKFKSDLDRFNCIKDDIIHSLISRFDEKSTIECVLPPSLNYLTFS